MMKRSRITFGTCNATDAGAQFTNLHSNSFNTNFIFKIPHKPKWRKAFLQAISIGLLFPQLKNYWPRIYCSWISSLRHQKHKWILGELTSTVISSCCNWHVADRITDALIRAFPVFHPVHTKFFNVTHRFELSKIIIIIGRIRWRHQFNNGYHKPEVRGDPHLLPSWASWRGHPNLRSGKFQNFRRRPRSSSGIFGPRDGSHPCPEPKTRTRSTFFK